MITQPPGDHDSPIVSSLDRRGPDDPRFGSIHVFLAVMITGLAAAVYRVL